MWDSKNFPFPVPQNTLFLSRGNGSVRSKRSKGRRKKERENRRETRRALCTDDRKEIGRDPRAASRTITNEIASLGLSTPLPSLCVSYATASRATTAPNKIQSRRGKEIITRLIGDGRNGRGSSSIRIQSQSPPGRGNFAFRSLGCLEKRERSFTFSTPVDNYRAIHVAYSRSLDSIVSSKGNVL